MAGEAMNQIAGIKPGFIFRHVVARRSYEIWLML